MVLADSDMETRAFAMGLLEAAPDAILLVREGGTIALVNRMAERVFGYERSEMIGQPVEMLVPTENREAHHSVRSRYERSPKLRMMSSDATLRAVRKNGTEFPVEIALSPIEVPGGRVTIAIVRDVTRHVELEDKLRYASTHDAMTGLFNRAHVDAKRAELEAHGESGGVILVDVDGLKTANDTQGHSAGDQLLKRTAIVLRNAAGPQDVVARLGGDEFVILCPNTDDTGLVATVRRVREELVRHNDMHHGPPLSFSLGSARTERVGGFSRAMRVADQRMYAEKRLKRQAR